MIDPTTITVPRKLRDQIKAEAKRLSVDRGRHVTLYEMVHLAFTKYMQEQ